MKLPKVGLLVALLIGAMQSPVLACERTSCTGGSPDVEFGPASLIASSVSGRPGAQFRSASGAPSERTYSLLTPCEFTDPRAGGCLPGTFSCQEVPDRIVVYYFVMSQRLVQEDRRAIDGLAPAPTADVGAPYGPVVNEGGSCVDVTDLNPPPSPDEVFRYFQTLPLPQLTTRQQPPGNALVGLPVIFWTDSPTTHTFTVDIRGFQVVIVATASGYTWHTGDGTDVSSNNPGQPYPHQTITYDYRAGTYTASLTTTWSATFSVDGGASADVPGTTTTDGPPVTFTVLQARTVLTNPYD
jgi:hypothetical protein